MFKEIIAIFMLYFAHRKKENMKLYRVYYIDIGEERNKAINKFTWLSVFEYMPYMYMSMVYIFLQHLLPKG